MATFFEKYKNLRKDQKISLEDIESRTKINTNYLEAIEAGNFDIIQKPYIRLFLRAYINEIGGDPDQAINELNEYNLKKDIPSAPAQKESKIEITDKKNVNKKKGTAPKAADKKAVPKEKPKSDFTKFQDILIEEPVKKTVKRSSLSPNLIKGILFVAFWVVAIIVIRNLTLSDETDSANETTTQIVEESVIYTSFEQLQTDFLETSSQQTALEQSLPLIVKIVSNNTIGLIAMQDTLENESVPIVAGDQQTFTFDANLDLLLPHSEGVSVYVNGDPVQDIRSQKTPVRLQFLVNPKSITIKHYEIVE